MVSGENMIQLIGFSTAASPILHLPEDFPVCGVVALDRTRVPLVGGYGEGWP